MKVLILAAVLAVALANQQYPKPAYPTPSYPKPSYPTPSYSAPSYPKASYDYPAQPYEFDWAVKDEPSYNDYNQQEKSDGKVVSGSYRVVLPDGRVQVVNYKVDDYSGYVADVKTEGEVYSKGYSAPYQPPKYPAKY